MIRQALAELRSLLPSGLLLEIAPVEDHLQKLPTEEQALVEHAVASRRHEFSSARFLAHQLLDELGEPRLPLMQQADRAPAWPAHVIGSLSHSQKWSAAAVSLANDELHGIGVDIEDQRPLGDNLFVEILTPRELAFMHETVASSAQSARVLAVFSIKEAIYKCMAPLGNAGLGFHAMELDFSNCKNGSELACGIVRPRLLPQADLRNCLPTNSTLQAYFLQREGVLFSVVSLTAVNGENQ